MRRVLHANIRKNSGTGRPAGKIARAGKAFPENIVTFVRINFENYRPDGNLRLRPRAPRAGRFERTTMNTKAFLEPMGSWAWWRSWMLIFLGCVLMGTGFVLFVNPYNFVPGGVYGMGIVLHNIFPSVQVGTFGYMFDIPLMLTALLVFGGQFGTRTVVAALFTPGFMNVLTRLVYPDAAAVESLDPALTRPGRFDRRVPVELPDLKGREDILKVHAKKVRMDKHVDYQKIARMASGASGAELANIVNEAALRAVRDGRKFATQADFEESIEVVIAGYQKKNRVLSNKEKLIVAYHEIGHALVAAKQTESAPVHKITIIPRTSGALGYTMQVDDGDHYLMTKEELANKIATFTGGRAAEELIFHSITTGASNDIEQATKLARAMISRYGMSEDFDMVAMENVTNQYLGGDSSLSCSFETQTLLDKKVVELVRMEHQKALKILQDNIGKLHELAKYLYEHETITGEEFMKILNAPVQVPTVVAESESNTKSENNAESENSTEADADTSSGKVNLQK